jgi:hypothetical protein
VSFQPRWKEDAAIKGLHDFVEIYKKNHVFPGTYELKKQ